MAKYTRKKLKRSGLEKPEAAPIPVSTVTQSVPTYLKPIVLAVEEAWEAPDADQYDHARAGYLEHLQQPFLELEKDRQALAVLVTHKVEQMIELAPDFFEKALSRSAFETGYFIERGESNVRKNK